MSLYYADTSAVIRLLVEESHSKAFAAFYDAHADAEWVSSALLRIELTRAVTRALPALLPDARDLLLAFSFVAMDDDIVEAAMNEPDRRPRSLDAIHLATARILGEDLDALVSYDDRLLKAATDAGLATASPRTDRRAGRVAIGPVPAGTHPGRDSAMRQRDGTALSGASSAAILGHATDPDHGVIRGQGLLTGAELGAQGVVGPLLPFLGCPATVAHV